MLGTFGRRSKLITYRYKAVMFGSVSSPFLLAAGNFNLRQWSSNSTTLMEQAKSRLLWLHLVKEAHTSVTSTFTRNAQMTPKSEDLNGNELDPEKQCRGHVHLSCAKGKVAPIDGYNQMHGFISKTRARLAAKRPFAVCGVDYSGPHKSSTFRNSTRPIRGSISKNPTEPVRMVAHLAEIQGVINSRPLHRAIVPLHPKQETCEDELFKSDEFWINNLLAGGPSTSQASYLVHFVLTSDTKKILVRKNKLKYCNVILDRIFDIDIPLRNICERTLRISVSDGGRSKKHAIIGHILYPLAPLLHPQEQPPIAAVITRDLTRDEDGTEQQSDQGEILVSLTFNDTLHRLTLTVFQAKGVQVNDGETVSWAKVSLMNGRRVVKARKTVVVAASDQPQYNESFHFKPPQAMESVHISVQLHIASNPGSKGRLIGRVIIGSFMFARGRALNHWNQCLAAPKEPIQYWHSLTE
ncbi:unnamed protein product, partial [Meganyctiphanes norvegica]